MTLITWLGLSVWIGFAALLIVPFKMKAGGYAHDRKGFGYRLMLDWGLGLVGVVLANGQAAGVYLFGFRILSLPVKSKAEKEKKKKRKKKRRSLPALAGWGRRHHSQLFSILRRCLSACHLTGVVKGQIGLPDPADTAKIHILGTGATILPAGFQWQVICRYDEEIIDLASEISARIVIGQFVLIALGLLVRRETRQMLKRLPQT